MIKLVVITWILDNMWNVSNYGYLCCPRCRSLYFVYREVYFLEELSRSRLVFINAPFAKSIKVFTYKGKQTLPIEQEYYYDFQRIFTTYLLEILRIYWFVPCQLVFLTILNFRLFSFSLVWLVMTILNFWWFGISLVRIVIVLAQG